MPPTRMESDISSFESSPPRQKNKSVKMGVKSSLGKRGSLDVRGMINKLHVNDLNNSSLSRYKQNKLMKNRSEVIGFDSKKKEKIEKYPDLTKKSKRSNLNSSKGSRNDFIIKANDEELNLNAIR